MTALRRAFVAVVPPVAALDAIGSVVERVRCDEPTMRWAPREQWHVTLRFLGPVPDTEALGDLVRPAVAGRSVRVGLGGPGAFPGPDRASIVWIGLREGLEGLRSLAESVDGAAVAAGFGGDAHPFRPHLTLARMRTPASVHDVLAAIGTDAVGPAWSVSEVLLFESETRPSGAVHRAVATFPLDATAVR